jgi:hypothetical protein
VPWIAAVTVFWVVSAIYFAPQFAGDKLAMGDVTQYGGMKQDIVDHRAQFDEDPQWTGGMFGGMPAYLITVKYPAMIIRNAAQWGLNLIGEPASLMFLAMLGFWIMLIMCRVDPWLAIPFALAYGLSTYNILIIEAGHITKMRALGYAPMLVGAVWWTLRRNVWVGGALAALFGTLLIAASHHQITYYFLLIVVAYWINELVVVARSKGLWRRFCVSTGVLVAAAILAAGANFTHLWYTFEHTPDTIRGGSEVAVSGDSAGAGGADSAGAGGLDLDYATAWSYGVGESLNMFIPNLRGGASSGGFAIDGQVANVLKRSEISPSIATQLPGYWGKQPGTGGPTYLGAVMVFLAVLGMFTLPGRAKWWIFGVSVLALLLAWGRNAMWFTELAFAILPGYNKFRTVAMALSVLQFTVPLLAVMTVADLCTRRIPTTRLTRALLWAVGVAGGTALIFALFGGAMFKFAAPSDDYFENVPGLVDAIRGERASLLKTDSWRSLIYVLLTAGVVWAWFVRGAKGAMGATGAKGVSGVSGAKSQQPARPLVLAAILSALVLCDLVGVDTRFLSHDDFNAPAQVKITPDDADREIMDDTEPGFRVFNVGSGDSESLKAAFNEAQTSYFHRSIGGYHAAKLSRYQDIIERYLMRFHPAVLGMLNTKYFIVSDPQTGERIVERNDQAFGPAWFVDSVEFVNGAQAELAALETTDLRHHAVVDERFKGEFPARGVVENIAQTGRIALTEYRPNYLKYKSSSPLYGVAVFSEIYYNKGWKAYVDGAETPYFRANYILRAMVVPAGDHIIEWRFRAPHFAAVEGVTLTSSIAIILWIIAAAIAAVVAPAPAPAVPAVAKKQTGKESVKITN